MQPAIAIGPRRCAPARTCTRELASRREGSGPLPTTCRRRDGSAWQAVPARLALTRRAISTHTASVSPPMADALSRLGRWAAGVKFDDLPAPAVEAAKDQVYSILAAVHAGFRSD